MAVEHAEALLVAQAGITVAKAVKDAYWKSRILLRHNSALAVDWGAQEKPSGLTEDVDGNIDGTSITRQELSNLLGSLDNFCKLLDNQSVMQGDHLGNLEKIAPPNV